MMKTSTIGRAVLMAREGVRLKAYRDSKGNPSIGCGHYNATPPEVKMGMEITMSEADSILATDLVLFEKAVNAAIRPQLTQNQFDACMSLAFNIGALGFSGSTVVRRLNAGLFDEAANAFLMWNKPAELLPRRQAEREQFLTPYEKALPKARTGEKPIAVPYTPKAENAVSDAPVAPVLTTATPIAVVVLPKPKTGLLAWITSIFRKV